MMIEPETVKLKCEAIRNAKILKSALKIQIKTVDKDDEADEAMRKILTLSEKCGQLFFYSESGEIYCVLPIYSNKTKLFYVAGPLVSLTMKDSLWEVGECIKLTAKSISDEKAKKAYPDVFKMYESHLLLSARLKNNAEFQNEINAIINELFEFSKNNCLLFKSAVLTLFILFKKICEESAIKQSPIFGKNFDLFYELRDAKEILDAKNILCRACEKLKLAFFGKISSKTTMVEEAVCYIKKHFGEKISLESVASMVFISPHYLSKAFYEEKGINFNTFLNKVRIENAKAMLKDGSKEIADVAKAVGFKDTSYFTKIFKKYANMTPTEYKMKIHLMSF